VEGEFAVFLGEYFFEVAVELFHDEEGVFPEFFEGVDAGEVGEVAELS
jgi:hypothetical protein